MSVVGYSTLEVIPTVKNLRSQIESQTSRDLAAAGRKGGQQFGDAAGTSAGRSFKTKFGSLAKDVAAPVAGIFAGAAVVGLFKDAIAGASDLAESGNKIQVIFGGATDQVQKFASQGAKALGTTQLDVLNAAGSFGTFGKAAGLSGGALADFSTKLVGLSTDMASFFNTSPEQAIEAIGAALRGEAEPIRAYGVLLDDATLRQEAMRQGLIQTTKQALTPQQKVLAAYQVILAQTKDAQGDFARTSGGLANQQRILSAQWSEMKTQLGSKLLPAATAIVRVFNDGVLPTLGAVGGTAADAGRSFAGLPGPVKAAAGAFVALRLAALAGIGTSVAAGVSSLGSAFVGLRIRALLAADAFRAASGSGLGAALAGIRAGAAGAATALRAVGTAFVPVAVITAAVTVWSKFRQAQADARQRAQELTDTLDAQTGALTENSKATVRKALFDSGALAAADRLGLSLETVTNAALGQSGAYEAVSAQMRARGQLDTKAAADAITLKNAIDGQSGAVKESVDGFRLLAAAQGHSTSSSSAVSAVMSSYASKVDEARAAVRGLRDEENKRRNANLGILGDQIALNQAVADAEKEAKKGKATLDLTTQAGRDNAGALRDLADAWNSSDGKVKNAKGAYADMRGEFIKVAEKMGATKDEAEKMAKKFLDIPKNVPVKFSTPGLKAALRDLQRLKDFASERIVITAQASKNRTDRANAFATGGLIGGRGSGTSDSNLIFASRGEFMQRKAAVDHYGVDFMRRLNNLQVPKYASGGLIGATTTAPAPGPLGQEIQGALRIVDGVAYIEGVARAVGASDRRATKLSGLDGVRR